MQAFENLPSSLLKGLRRRLALVLGAFAIPALLTACAAQSLPTYEPSADPAISVTSNTQSVTEIVWDDFGVPHIYASNNTQGYKAFGWAQMEARGNLILRLYAEARGESALHFGEGEYEKDLLVHQLDLPNQAGVWLKNLEPETRDHLVAFVAGMNAWAKANPDRIDSELEAILPVQTTDPLAHTYNVIHLNFMAQRQIRVPQTEQPSSPGSNAYAIAPAKSKSGHPILLANPHLPWSGIYTWIEVHLSIPKFEIYGAVLAGMPWMGVGFGEYGGWTHTVNHLDGADLYELTLVGDGYSFDGEVSSFATRQAVISVKDEIGNIEQRSITVKESVHGPVIEEREGKAYAARLASLDSFGLLKQYEEMAAARSLQEFEAATSQLQMPLYNTIYTSASGDIYFLHGGKVPDREIGDWDYWGSVVPGTSSETLWSSYLPYELSPSFSNPASGFIQNANDPPWYASSPFPLDPMDFPSWVAPVDEMALRPQRSLRFMRDHQKVSFEELVAFKQSNHLELADRALDDLLLAVRQSPAFEELKEAYDVLSVWDRTADAGSKGTILFLDWADRMLEADAAGNRFFASSWRPIEALTSPNAIANPNFAVEKLGEAMASVKENYGDLAIPYGDIVRLKLGDHDLPASGTYGKYGAFRVSWEASDADLNRTIIGGDSFTFAVEFAEKIQAVGILPYGNSEDPASPHFGDQLELYSNSKLRPLRFYRNDVETHSVSRQTVE